MPEKLELQQMLENEFSILEELNGLSVRKQDALLKNDLDSLEHIVLKEEALSGNLSNIEAACSKQVQFFLMGKDEGGRNTDLDAELKRLIHNVRNKAQELKRNNDLNQEMINDSLSVFRFMINALMPQESKSVYEASGKMQKHKKVRRTFDYKL